jgi:hypothetical protein
MGLYESLEAMPDGKSHLAQVRLSRTIEVALYKAGVPIPRRWFRPRRVDSLTVTELAHLLESAGLELDVTVLPYGELRSRATEGESA